MKLDIHSLDAEAATKTCEMARFDASRYGRFADPNIEGVGKKTFFNIPCNYKEPKRIE